MIRPLPIRSAAHLTFLALLIALGGTAPGCEKKPQGPEEQVRAVLSEMEDAAERRAVGDLKELISESYSDTRGQTKQDLAALTTYYFFQHKQINLLQRVSDIMVTEQGTVAAEVLVALSGTPLADAAALSGVHADLYRFDFEFSREGEHWRLLHAEWRPAELGDFME